jgi:hypothetical protein
MSFETDLRTLIVNAGTAAEARVYWKVRPQDGVLPAIVLSTAFGGRSQTMDGPMGTQGNRIQFDCMASTKAEAVALRQTVMPIVERGGAAGETKFQGGFVNLYRDDFTDTSSGPVHTEQFDATIWFN